MPKALTSKRSHRERTAVERLYKYAGARKVSFYYQYPDGSNETLASADAGDRAAVQRAERSAIRRARELQESKIIIGSVSELIDRFQTEIAPTHFRDQSNDGLAVCNGELANLVRFFGKMSPAALRPVHGYQYLEARANSGAPAKANKELSLMSTICNFAVRWGLIEANPFIRLMRNRTDKRVRVVSRSQIVRFYLWSLRQPSTFRNPGCAAMFTYLTGFRAAEVRPFRIEGLCSDGVRVISAKRKRGEFEIIKVREWSPKLRGFFVVRPIPRECRPILAKHEHPVPPGQAVGHHLRQELRLRHISIAADTRHFSDRHACLPVRPLPSHHDPGPMQHTHARAVNRLIGSPGPPETP